jgi:hypothetical protein
MLKCLTLAILICGVAATVQAKDVYVVQIPFESDRIVTANPCTIFSWVSSILALNPTSTAGDVRLLGVSNGSMRADPQVATVAPGQVAILWAVSENWVPVDGTPSIIVLHLDIADGLILTPRLEPVGSSYPGPCPTGGGVVAPPQVRGYLRLPTVDALVPAGTPQAFAGADLEDLINTSYATVYNAGTTTAHAEIAVYRGCDGQLLGSQNVTVPANTVMQFPATGPYECDTRSGRYIVVTSDQPGFAIVSASDDDPFKKMPMSVLGPNE